MNKEITLNVPQGIGDIFWVYQKFAPYFDCIHFNIAVLSDSPVEARSRGWLQLLPKCGQVNFVQRGGYNPNVIPPSMHDILIAYEAGYRTFDYACNAQLEKGIRLEGIDKKHEVAWDIPLRNEINPLRPPPYTEFLTLYLSGHTLNAQANGLWSVAQWVEFTRSFHARWLREHPYAPAAIPIMVVGAEYDREAATLAATMLDADVTLWIDRPPIEVAWVLKNTRFFLGYQSGLGILADNFNTPQVMMYFNHLTKLMYSWCQPSHAGRTFNAAQFRQSPSEVLASLSLPT